MKSLGCKPQFDHEKIKQLLTEGYRPIDVAQIVGCSRERVRQLDWKYFGMTGRERMLIASTTQFNVRYKNASEPPEHPFVLEALKRGLKVEGVVTAAIKTSVKRVLVNGYRCSLHKAIRRPAGNHVYWQIRRVYQTVADFYIWQGPTGFLILPHDEQPNDATMLTFRPRMRAGAYSKRHDYLNYLNAWNQLERKPNENLKAS
jgi:hypothetical protein